MVSFYVIIFLSCNNYMWDITQQNLLQKLIIPNHNSPLASDMQVTAIRHSGLAPLTDCIVQSSCTTVHKVIITSLIPGPWLQLSKPFLQ